MTRQRITVRAGRDELRTEGVVELVVVNNKTLLRVTIDMNTASARFFASHYGRAISVEIEQPTAE